MDQVTQVPDGVAMTPDRIARRLRVSRRTVYRWIESGELIAANIGSPEKPKYRVFNSSLEDFIRLRYSDSRKAQAAADHNAP